MAKADQAKSDILEALRAFVNQRPGFDLRDYSSMSNYRGDQRPVQKQREIAHALINWVDWHDSITAADIIESARHTVSGRLSIAYDHDTHKCDIDYRTGQHFPTEFRLAVVRVLSDSIWHWLRSDWENGKPGFHNYAIKFARQNFGNSAAKYFL